MTKTTRTTREKQDQAVIRGLLKLAKASLPAKHCGEVIKRWDWGLATWVLAHYEEAGIMAWQELEDLALSASAWMWAQVWASDPDRLTHNMDNFPCDVELWKISTRLINGWGYHCQVWSISRPYQLVPG